VLKEANGRSIDELAEMLDELLLELVKLRTLQTKAATT
jgi:ribosomal protein L29